MDFTLKPSLQHLAIVKVVSALNIQDYFYYRKNYLTYSEMCYEIEKKVIKKLEKLQLSELLKRKMLEIVRPMINEIAYYWKDRHYDLPISIWRNDFIRWTPEGTVDYKKTAEVLIEFEELDIKERYNIACRFCLEHEIPKLWAKLSKHEKERFIEESNVKSGRFDTSRFWTWRMRGESCSNDIPEMYSWRRAFEAGENKEFTEYALQKLTPAERKESLERSVEKAAYTYSRVCEKRNSKILFFLLPQISEEQRIALVKKFAYGILMNLLNWPWQHLFLDTAEKCNFLPLEEYKKINESIIYRASRRDDYCYKDYDYKSLFREFLQRSPLTHKYYIYMECDAPAYGPLKTEDPNEMKRILNDRVNEYIINLIDKDDWNYLSDLYG